MRVSRILSIQLLLSYANEKRSDSLQLPVKLRGNLRKT